MNTYTYSMWVRPDRQQEDGFAAFISRNKIPSDNKNLNWFGLHPNSNFLLFQTKSVTQGTTDWLESDRDAISFDQWSHFTWSYD